ncbi:MAG: hypothetical protein ICV73_04300 [Acetobacteraceae bacterium]|nr:hypothetical protein [Acetobacteraceae bacterium]
MPPLKLLAASATVASSFLAAAQPALADPFRIDVELPGTRQTGSGEFTDVETAINQLRTEELTRLVPGYTSTTPATAQIFLRGLRATAAFPDASTTLTFSVGGTSIQGRTFTGPTREDSAELLRRFIEGRDNGATRELLRAAVRLTAVDPVAGNPNALANRMVASDFDRALDAAGGVRTGAALGARFGSFSGGGLTSRNLSLPLGYSWRLSDRDELEVDAPVAWTDTEGANSYSANAGLLWRRRVLPNWTLQPSVRFGAVGSRDLGSGAGAWSAAINSTVNFDLPAALRLTVANGLTYIATIPVSVGRYSLDYGLSNVVFRNGAVLGRDLGFDVLGMPVRGSVFAVDTRFTGDAVYAKNYQEFGAFFSAGGVNPIRFGVTYINGSRGLRGFTVNTGVVF